MTPTTPQDSVTLKIRIAVIDDEPIACNRLKQLLENQTMEIETFESTQWLSWVEKEKDYIQQALEATSHNKIKAAEILQMPRTTLWRKIRKYGLEI